MGRPGSRATSRLVPSLALPGSETESETENEGPSNPKWNPTKCGDSPTAGPGGRPRYIPKSEYSLATRGGSKGWAREAGHHMNTAQSSTQRSRASAFPLLLGDARTGGKSSRKARKRSSRKAGKGLGEKGARAGPREPLGPLHCAACPVSSLRESPVTLPHGWRTCCRQTPSQSKREKRNGKRRCGIVIYKTCVWSSPLLPAQSS